MLAFILAAAITAVHDSYPAMSPDGTILLFQSNRSGRQAIWAAKPDGSDPRVLFDRPEIGIHPGTPNWSPDRRTIVFAMRPIDATDDNESEIYTIAADGSGLRRLTKAPGDDSHPHWSADGKRIFFNSARATPDLKAEWGEQWIDIYSMASDGSDLKRHTDCKGTCTYPVPSPDGQWIAHRRRFPKPARDWEQQPTKADSEVVLTSLTGGPEVNLSRSPAYDGWPMWSPDSQWVVFASNRDGGVSIGQIYRVRVDGSGLERITAGPLSNVQPSFTPDGKSLLVYRLVEWPNAEIGHIAKVPFEGGKE